MQLYKTDNGMITSANIVASLCEKAEIGVEEEFIAMKIRGLS